MPDIPGDDLSLPNITFGQPQEIPSGKKQPTTEEPQRSTVHVFKPVQKASTSRGHDTESAIELKSEIKQTCKILPELREQLIKDTNRHYHPDM